MTYFSINVTLVCRILKLPPKPRLGFKAKLDRGRTGNYLRACSAAIDHAVFKAS